jgi:hypothetical protein
VMMAGADRAGAANKLLAQFDLSVPPWHARPGESYGPLPQGMTNCVYRGGEDYKNFMHFYGAWPIEHPNQSYELAVRLSEDRPMAVVQNVGKGRVLLIGDTEFALNKNLETSTGQPPGDRHENAHFWRWFLTRVRGEPEWIPPDPEWTKRPVETESGTESQPPSPGEQGARRRVAP